MQLKQKIFLLAFIPLAVATGAIVFAVRQQAAALAVQQRAFIQRSYLASKEVELQHYTALAARAVSHLYQRSPDDALAREEAKRILAGLRYGDDGYFFIYDLQGNCLMHPLQPAMVGRNWWQLRDADGTQVIRQLIERALAGGGTVRYQWDKPSSRSQAPKLGYVTVLERWGWVIGTGIYLDDVDAALASIDRQICDNINSTMLLIAAIAILVALLIALGGLALNLSESRVADAKLQVLTQRLVHSQEDERARLSRDLHDAIGQALVCIQLELEAGVAALQASGARTLPAAFQRAGEQLRAVFGEVRRISHNLRPSLLDDLGLAAALRNLASEMALPAAQAPPFAASGCSEALAPAAKIALYRIAQEALNNARRHAGASSIRLALIGGRKRVRLLITDNGCGFDLGAVALHPKRGIGLRNMHERLHALGGSLRLVSSAGGTTVIATLPKP